MIHATCIAVDGTGVLLRGRSGSGKSDLALRLIDGGALLVADDRVNLSLQNGCVIATSPPQIAGLLEVRGLGIVPVPSVAAATVGLVVDLEPAASIERLPEPAFCAYLGVRLALMRLDPFQPSAAAKMRLAVSAARSGREARPVVVQGQS